MTFGAVKGVPGLLLTCFEAVCDADEMYTLLGLPIRGFLAGVSGFVGSVAAEGLFWWVFRVGNVLDVLEMESRIRSNFRLETLSAYDILLSVEV